MVLVDTNIWIQLYQKKETRLGELLWDLVAKNEAAVCGQIWVEFLGGFRKEEERKHFEKSFHAFPFIETGFRAFQLAAEILSDYPKLGSGDAIIAATAIIEECLLLTLDKDFQLLTKEGLTLLPIS